MAQLVRLGVVATSTYCELPSPLEYGALYPSFGYEPFDELPLPMSTQS